MSFDIKKKFILIFYSFNKLTKITQFLSNFLKVAANWLIFQNLAKIFGFFNKLLYNDILYPTKK